MKIFYKILVLVIITGFSFLVVGCFPVKNVITNQYKLNAYCQGGGARFSSQKTILITQPEAVGAYQTKQMLYVNKNFEIASFAQNAWISPPAEMLFPLIIQSLQGTGDFRAVLNSSSDEPIDYKLDTQLLELDQNFLTKPSVIHLSLKAVLSDVTNNRIIASRIFKEQVRCPADNPYGGVVAANIATERLTAQLLHFIRAKISVTA